MRLAPISMLSLHGLVLCVLLLSGAARRSIRHGNSFHAAQQKNTVAKAFDVSADTRMAFLPWGLGAALLPRRGPPLAALRAAAGKRLQPRAPQGQLSSMREAVPLQGDVAKSSHATGPLAALMKMRVPLTRPSAVDDDYDELDAMDTSTSWDEELAEFEAWQAMQKAAEKAKEPAQAAQKTPVEAPLTVDEEAHLDVGGEALGGDEDAAARTLRQMSEKQAQLTLQAIELRDGPSTDKAVLTSLEAIINALGRLTNKVDKLSAKVNTLQSEAAAVPAATPAGPEEWDGKVDEDAWRLDDDGGDDLPDWRDAWRHKKLDEADADLDEEV